jgi:hypothetical protein
VAAGGQAAGQRRRARALGCCWGSGCAAAEKVQAPRAAAARAAPGTAACAPGWSGARRRGRRGGDGCGEGDAGTVAACGVSLSVKRREAVRHEARGRLGQQVPGCGLLGRLCSSGGGCRRQGLLLGARPCGGGSGLRRRWLLRQWLLRSQGGQRGDGDGEGDAGTGCAVKHNGVGSLLPQEGLFQDVRRGGCARQAGLWEEWRR